MSVSVDRSIVAQRREGSRLKPLMKVQPCIFQTCEAIYHQETFYLKTNSIKDLETQVAEFPIPRPSALTYMEIPEAPNRPVPHPTANHIPPPPPRNPPPKLSPTQVPNWKLSTSRTVSILITTPIHHNALLDSIVAAAPRWRRQCLIMDFRRRFGHCQVEAEC